MKARYLGAGAGAGAEARVVLGVVVAVGITSGVLGVLGGGTALAAQSVSRTLKYTCTGYPVSVRIDADIPSSARVDVATPRFTIGSVTTVSAAVIRLANLAGVKTVEGSGQAKVNVSAPQGDIPISVPINIPRTAIPSSGSGQIRASGAAPSLSFKQPGRGSITIGDLILHVVPRDARGNLTLGELDLTCKLDRGQDNMLASFEIAKAPTSPATSRPAGPTPPRATKPRATNPTPPRAAGTATATPGATTPGAATDSTPITAGGTTVSTGGSLPTGTTDPAAAIDSAGTAAGAGGAVATGTGGLGPAALILLVLGIATVGAVALRFGPRLRNRRRGGGIGSAGG